MAIDIKQCQLKNILILILELIQLTITINFISSEDDTDEDRVMH